MLSSAYLVWTFVVSSAAPRNKNRTKNFVVAERSEKWLLIVSDFQVHIVPAFEIIQKKTNIEYFLYTSPSHFYAILIKICKTIPYTAFTHVV